MAPIRSLSGAAPEFGTVPAALPHALQYRAPPRIRGADLVMDDAGDLDKDGFTESEGCFVLGGPGPLTMAVDRGSGAGFALSFKIVGWKSDVPRSVTLDNKETPAASALVGGSLILQVMGRIESKTATLNIGK